LAFQASACKSVQKGAKAEPGETAVTASQTNTEETGTSKATARTTTRTTATTRTPAKATTTAKPKTAGTETSKAKAGSTETDKDKQGKLAEIKEEVITEVEKILTPSVKKAMLPSGVGLLILISLLSSKERKRRK